MDKNMVAVAESCDASTWRDRIISDQYKEMCDWFVESVMQITDSVKITPEYFEENLAFFGLMESNTANLISYLYNNELVDDKTAEGMEITFYEASSRCMQAIADALIAMAELYNRMLEEARDSITKRDATIKNLMDALIVTGKEVLDE